MEGKWLGSTYQPARCTVRVGTCTHEHTAPGRQIAGVHMPACTVHCAGWYLHTGTHGTWKANGWGLHTSQHGARCGLVRQGGTQHVAGTLWASTCWQSSLVNDPHADRCPAGQSSVCVLCLKSPRLLCSAPEDCSSPFVPVRLVNHASRRRGFRMASDCSAEVCKSCFRFRGFRMAFESSVAHLSSLRGFHTALSL